MRGHRRKRIKSDRKINRENKKLMIEKILSYNPNLIEGIEVYKDASRNFILLIFFAALLINFPLISIPCCTLSIFYLIKMLKFIRYNSINNIVKTLAKDLTFKGIYDKEKAEDMLNDFKVKYGENVCENLQLESILEKYEAFVTKIEQILKSIDRKEVENNRNNNILDSHQRVLSNIGNANMKSKIKRKQFIARKVYSAYEEFDNKESVFYKNEDGQIKMVNKAIEFFDTESSNSYNNENAVVLQNIGKENKNLTVYLYKKSSPLQKNAL